MTLRRLLIALAVVMLAVSTLSELFPSPDPAWRITCPNHAGRRSRTGGRIPAVCGDTTAVTFGYVR